MPFVEFTALLALATAMSFTPGPNTTLSTALAANRGLPHAMRFVCAVPVGWSALLLLCAGGVGALVLAAPMLRLAIKAVGIGYLLWLAWKLSQTASLAAADSARLDVVLPVMLLFAFFSNLAYAATGALLRQWLAQGRRLLWFNRAMAGVLTATAAWMTTA